MANTDLLGRVGMGKVLPAIFFGHGNPMNAIQRNGYTEAWSAIGKRIGKPKAVLSISAHWYVPMSGVTVSTAPKTIHDFGGFPEELFRVQYPAPGDPVLAAKVVQVLAPIPVFPDSRWGLDHGTWSVLCHVYPEADVPIVQLSIDESKPAEFHMEVGRRLAPLREEGVLIVGSGNLVHNLHTYAWGAHPRDPYDWAVRFEQEARATLLAGEHAPLVNYEKLGRDAELSVPTPDHFLPLLYVLGTRQAKEPVSFPVEGVDGGSISMLSVEVGHEASGRGGEQDTVPDPRSARGSARHES
jgi:4,5-DOPA dioxygenase extradiol